MGPIPPTPHPQSQSPAPSSRAYNGMNHRRYHSPPPAYRGPVASMPLPVQASSYFLFQNRVEAGRMLGEALSELQGRDDVIVIGVPRGGVVVAQEVARVLHAPLDVWLSA